MQNFSPPLTLEQKELAKQIKKIFPFTPVFVECDFTQFEEALEAHLVDMLLDDALDMFLKEENAINN